MADNKFDAKSFNPQAFKYKADRVPRVRLNEMRKSRVLTGNPDIRAVLGSQDGTAYARIAMRGIGGAVLGAQHRLCPHRHEGPAGRGGRQL